MPHPLEIVKDPARPASRLAWFASVIMSISLISRVLGFLRDVMLAHIFGATAAFDAFVIAFKIPNFMRRLFGEGVFSQAFIPIIVERRAQQNKVGVGELMNRMASAFGLLLLAIVIIGEIIAPLFVLIFAPGFVRDPQRYKLAIHLVQITLPYLLCIGWVALAGAFLNAYNRFALTAFVPIVLNVGLITVAVFWAGHLPPTQGVMMLAIGVTLSGMVQLLIQWPALHRLGLMPKLSRWKADSHVSRALKQMFSAIWGVSAAQVSLLLDNLFASFLAAGSISWLYYADRLIYFPLGIIGVALATVVMPKLSQHHYHKEQSHFSNTLDWALRCVLVTSIPAGLGLIWLAGPILASLLHHGAFTAHDVSMTQRSLMAFSIGLPGLMMVKIFAAACYSRQDMGFPARAAGLSLFLNLVLNGLFIVPLAQAGLALATALASWLNAVLLWNYLRRQQILQWQPEWLRICGGITLGSVLLTAVLLLGKGSMTLWLTRSVLQNIGILILLIIAGAAGYFLGLKIVGLRWRHFKI